MRDRISCTALADCQKLPSETYSISTRFSPQADRVFGPPILRHLSPWANAPIPTSAAIAPAIADAIPPPVELSTGSRSLRNPMSISHVSLEERVFSSSNNTFVNKTAHVIQVPDHFRRVLDARGTDHRCSQPMELVLQIRIGGLSVGWLPWSLHHPRSE